MWNELASYKNHFLQFELHKSTKPEFINDMVHSEFKKVNARRNLCQIPTKHECKHSTYFDDRAQLAYGWFALPKLMRELCSDNNLTQWRAITSLTEFLLNPLNAQRAITEMDIVRKIYNCLMRIRLKYQAEEYQETEKLLRIFQILSNYQNGSEKMAVNYHLIRELYKIIEQREKHHILASKILRNLTEKPKVLLMLQPPYVFELLCEIFLSDPCAPHFEEALWQHLGHFLEYYPERGIKNGLFELMHSRIVREQPQCHRMNMKMFALMLRCPDGQQRFDAHDCLKLLYGVLSEPRSLDTYEYVLLALLHGLHSKRVLWRARELIDLPEIVVQVANDTNNARTQLYCLQVLRQLSEMPCIKRYINANCHHTLAELSTANYLNECNRDELLNWLKHEPYHTSN